MDFSAFLGQIRRQYASTNNLRVFFCVVFIAAGAIEIVVATNSLPLGRATEFLALNLLLGGAAGLSGGLIGFIFGIPRMLASETAPAQPILPGESSPRSRPNTNLEQISDWLTKVLVGASLTSLSGIPSFLKGLADYFEKGAYAGMPGGGTLPIFIIIYFAAGGFFWSYIETRTYLTWLFESYGGSGVGVDALTKVRNAPWEPGSSPIPEDELVIGLQDSALTTAGLLQARAAAETRRENYSAAADYYQKAIAKDPGDTRLQNRLSAIYARLGKVKEAEALNSRVRESTTSNSLAKRQADATAIFNALYVAPPEGFQRAISIGAPLLAANEPMDGEFFLYMACAYAQQLEFRCKAGNIAKSSIDPTDPDRIKVIDLLTVIKSKYPALMQSAQRLWKPSVYGGPLTENDLAILDQDADVTKILGS